MNFTKSKYVEYLKCVKAAWLTKHKLQERVWDEQTLQRFEEGHLVGDFAKGYFGDYVEATTHTDEEGLDFSHMLALTKQYVDNGEENICEAAFSWNGLYCAVDILHREGDGYAIYEVKSTTSVKDEHIIDVAYQKYVLEGCDVKVTGAYVLHINKEYVRYGDVDLQALFCKQNVWDEVCAEQARVADVLKQAERDVMQKEEPKQALTRNCEGCGYFAYCTKGLPKPNVFDSHFAFGKQLGYYADGVITLEQVADAAEQEFLSAHPAALKDENVHVEKEEIQSFLNGLSHPLYFLDFETMKPIVPLFEGTKPNQQIPFQYSLHFIEQEGGVLQHKEFLAVSGTDPRRAVAERLVADIPTNACVLAYYMSFEQGRIAELADAFPDLASHLMAIHDNIVDLIVPFKQQNCYTRAMEGSASIKYVLPALFPDDPSLNYHNLEGVHNGGEAMNIFPKIATMSPEDAQKARQNLLDYCCLDTYAMVKIWQELIRLTK